MSPSLRAWLKSGTPWVWLHAGALATSLVMIVGLLAVITVRGLDHFWPTGLADVRYSEPGAEPAQLLGQLVDSYTVSAQRVQELGFEPPPGALEVQRHLLKVGNRDLEGADFRWLTETGMGTPRYPSGLMAVERLEWGDFYGRLTGLRENGVDLPADEVSPDALQQRIDRATALRERIREIEKDDIGAINYAIEQLRLDERALEMNDALTAEARARLQAERDALEAEFAALRERLAELRGQIGRDALVAETASGRELVLPLGKVVRAYFPNDMGFGEKLAHYGAKLWEFVSAEPREANTEGGIFPAIFGTVLMVLLMSVLVTPFGVVAAVYLREYAKQNLFTRMIRIAVNNLAGVPSVVYGVFGLGFFVYFLGGNIDRLFYPESLPAPTFGTPGLLWSSLTLALLTVPVVIVATEEGLSRIPRAIREGSLALGATKAETLWRTVLPMATPAMMTGLILAVARAAGEVAPLMLVGVVKLAPTLPLDGNFPYLHLDRKFMHLGFHIYDVGFQSPNVEAARPLVYSTALLLVLVIVVLNLSAIRIRRRLEAKYNVAES